MNKRLSFALARLIHDPARSAWPAIVCVCGVASSAPVGGCARPHPASNPATMQPSAKGRRPEILIACLLKLDEGAVFLRHASVSIAKAAFPPLSAGFCRLTNSHGIRQRNRVFPGAFASRKTRPRVLQSSASARQSFDYQLKTTWPLPVSCFQPWYMFTLVALDSAYDHPPPPPPPGCAGPQDSEPPPPPPPPP